MIARPSLPPEFRRFPKAWVVKPFTEAVRDATGGNPKVQKRDYRTSGRLPVIDQGQDYIGGYVDDTDTECKVPLPCILFGDHTRQFKWVDRPFALGADGVKVLVPRDDLDPRFAYYYLRKVRLPEDAGYSRHFKFLKETYVPIPPLLEQKRIAAILDRADAIRRKRQQATQTADNLITAIFYDLFGDPVTNPKGLPVAKLQELASTATGGTPDRKNPSYFGGHVPWVKSGELHQPVVTDVEETLTEEGLNNSSAKLFPPGTILVAMYGATVGVTSLLGIEASTNQAICCIQPGPEIDGAYLLYALKLMTPHLLVRRIGGAQPNISQGILRSLLIPQPAIAEQQRFAESVSEVVGILNRHNVFQQESDGLFDSLIQRAFKGDL